MNKTILIQTIQFSISIDFVNTQLNVKTVLFQTIQFSVNTVSMSKQFYFLKIQFCISTQFSSILPIYKTQPVSTTQGQSGPGSDGNEGILHIPQSPALLEPHHQIVLCHIQDTH